MKRKTLLAVLWAGLLVAAPLQQASAGHRSDWQIYFGFWPEAPRIGYWYRDRGPGWGHHRHERRAYREMRRHLRWERRLERHKRWHERMERRHERRDRRRERGGRH